MAERPGRPELRSESGGEAASDLLAASEGDAFGDAVAVATTHSATATTPSPRTHSDAPTLLAPRPCSLPSPRASASATAARCAAAASDVASAIVRLVRGVHAPPAAPRRCCSGGSQADAMLAKLREWPSEPWCAVLAARMPSGSGPPSQQTASSASAIGCSRQSHALAAELRQLAALGSIREPRRRARSRGAGEEERRCVDRPAWPASAKACDAASRHEPRRLPPVGWSPAGGWPQPGPHEPRREVAEIAPLPASNTAATEQAEPRRDVVDIARFAASNPACIRSAARTAARCLAWFLRCLFQRERQSGMLYVSVTFLPFSWRSLKCSRMICSSRFHSMTPSGC